ncbi:MAG TPA: helix-turn-helix domain-containing protein [Bordetella sp.]
MDSYLPAAPRESCSNLIHSSYDVASYPVPYRLLVWRERMANLMDIVLPTLDELERPFQARAEYYQVGGLTFIDCTADAVVLERSPARIATDKVRDFIFYVYVEGGADSISVRASGMGGTSTMASILAVDLGQPIRLRRNAGRMLIFCVPKTLVQEVFPNPEFIHGHRLCGCTPLVRMIISQASHLAGHIGGMSAEMAQAAIQASVRMLLLALGRQAKLSGSARALARAIMLGEAQRYIQAHLADAELSPDAVLKATQLPRRSLYRLFEEEGGLAAYIRHLRLRRAAEDLTNFPHMPVTDIAYGLGFRSPSDFTRAFRRIYAMAPQDFRVMSLSL